MFTRSAYEPLCASFVKFHVALLSPKVSNEKQSGAPPVVLLYSSEALRRTFHPFGADGATGPGTAGCTDPPITSCTLLTTTPFVASWPCNHDNSEVKSDCVIQFVSQALQIW